MDALADHPNQVDKSPYAYAWNNPINLTDPDGNCPECEEKYKNPSEGQTYISKGNANYTYSDGNWTRQGGELAEVKVSPQGFYATPPFAYSTGNGGTAGAYSIGGNYSGDNGKASANITGFQESIMLMKMGLEHPQLL